MNRRLNEKEKNAFMEAKFSDHIVVFKSNFEGHSSIFLFSYIAYNVLCLLSLGNTVIFGQLIFSPPEQVFLDGLVQNMLKIRIFIGFCTIFMFNLTFAFGKGFFVILAFSLMFTVHGSVEIIRQFSDQLLYGQIGIFQVFFIGRILISVTLMLMLLEIKFPQKFSK